MEVSVGDIDRYMDMRASKLTRSSLKCVAERLRSLLRYLHRTRLIGTDLSPHVLAPRLYAYEGVPSILERDQIVAVLASASMDKTPAGLRDHAILQLLATYGLRSGEIRNMRIEDIGWRRDAIRVRHSKNASLLVPSVDGAGWRSNPCLSAFRTARDRCERTLRPHACTLLQARQAIQHGSTAAS